MYERKIPMSIIKINDMAACERPYEKAKKYGVSSLGDAELIAILLRSGSRESNVIDIAQLILNSHPVYKGLSGLNYLTEKELTKIKGVGEIKACQIMALCELSKRMARTSFKSRITLDSPEAVADYFMENMRYLAKERMYALFFNGSNALVKEIMISEGTVNASPASPREIFIEALKYDAVSLILVHNHPSGNPEPSNADIVVSKKIKAVGDMLGIKLLDHIIVGDMRYSSLVERGLL